MCGRQYTVYERKTVNRVVCSLNTQANSCLNFIKVHPQQHAVGDGRLHPSAATWRTERNASSLTLDYLLHYLKNITLSVKLEVHNSAVQGEPSHGNR